MKKLFNKIKQFLIKVFIGGNNVNYLSGSEALPKPLDEDLEKELLLKLCDGDASVKKDLIEHNLRLVVYIARKFDNTGIDLDDLISIGTIGLIKAINSFNVDKKIKLEKLRVILSGTLDERESEIINMRYGLGGTEELTQREIAKKLGISRSYVSRIEKSALEKLRRQF